jgi:hypothetical protein
VTGRNRFLHSEYAQPEHTQNEFYWCEVNSGKAAIQTKAITPQFTQ